MKYVDIPLSSIVNKIDIFLLYKNNEGQYIQYYTTIDAYTTAVGDFYFQKSLILKFTFTLPTDFPSDINQVYELDLYLYNTSVSDDYWDYYWLAIMTDDPNKIFSTQLAPNANLSLSLVFPMLNFNMF